MFLIDKKCGEVSLIMRKVKAEYYIKKTLPTKH